MAGASSVRRRVEMVRNGKSLADESGQALLLVIFLIVAGSVLVAPLLSFAATGLNSSRLVFDKKTSELYAADAGVEHARWQVKYGHVAGLTYPTDYDRYDFSTTWPDPGVEEPVNGKAVNVTIQNVWVPLGIAVPNAEQARSIIDGSKLMVTGTTVATGILIPPSSKISQYRIKVTYYPGVNESLKVNTLGIWLPPGFDYYTDSTHKSSLQADSQAPYYAVPAVQPHAGSEAVLWNWSSNPVSFTSFPGVNASDSPMTMDITFYFIPPQAQPEQKPDAIAWVTTSGVSGIPYSWDADVGVYKITSVAGNTTVESYISKVEMRKLQSAMAGDYYATGNTLMVDTNYDQYGIRDQLLSSSDANVTAVPQDAEVGAAFLYWSAWRSESAKIAALSDTCSNFNNWVNGSAWSLYTTSNPTYFRGHYGGAGDTTRYLTLKNNLNIGSYSPGTAVVVSWDQYITRATTNPGPSDGLDFAFSADGGATWGPNIQAFRGYIGTSPVNFRYTIPGQYLSGSFKMKFYLVGFGTSGQYCNLDNIKVIAMPPDTSVVFKINDNQVYFDGDGQPQQGASQLISSKNQVLPNYSGSTPNGFSYSGYRDVTALVRKYSAKAPDPGINYPGNAKYTVGSLSGDTGNQWSYAGWSIIIIYTSPATQGHQLYLYDKFIYANDDTDIDFDNDGKYGGTITGFIVPQQIPGEVNAAKLTAFVGEGDACWTGDFLAFNAPAGYWSSPTSNPWSIPGSYKLWDGTNSSSNSAASPNNVWNGKAVGLSADGVDIDTFNVTWSSGLLRPGDTSAHIDLPTNSDSWNLVYLILSFRSTTTTGGALNYLIR